MLCHDDYAVFKEYAFPNLNAEMTRIIVLFHVSTDDHMSRLSNTHVTFQYPYIQPSLEPCRKPLRHAINLKIQSLYKQGNQSKQHHHQEVRGS